MIPTQELVESKEEILDIPMVILRSLAPAKTRARTQSVGVGVRKARNTIFRCFESTHF
jgi:hypothetical protein